MKEGFKNVLLSKHESKRGRGLKIQIYIKKTKKENQDLKTFYDDGGSQKYRVIDIFQEELRSYLNEDSFVSCCIKRCSNAY